MKDIGYSRYHHAWEPDEEAFFYNEELEAVRRTFSHVIQKLYGEDDLEDLDGDVDVLCDLLRLDIPKNSLNVERRPPLFTNKMQMVNALERASNN